VFILFVFAPFLQPHSLTYLFTMTLVLLSLIQAESSCEKEVNFSILLQRVLSMEIMYFKIIKSEN